MINALAVETDTHIAALYNRLDRVETEQAYADNAAHYMAGDRGKLGYGGRRTFALSHIDAWLRVASLARGADEYHLTISKRPSDLLAKRDELDARRAQIREEIARLERVWATNGRWSRFFVVTSSSGHVHATTACRSCRISTTFGWMPEFSGRTEAEAVAELGAALCTVCFPSAPVEMTGAKITKARAQRLAA